MLVKHNFWSGIDNLAKTNFNNYENRADIKIDGDYISGQIKPGFEDALIILQREFEELYDEKVTMSMNIANLGGIPLYFQQQGFNGLQLNVRTIRPGDRVNVKIQGLYEKINYSRQYRFYIKDTGYFNFSCKHISIYKGHGADIYLPHKDNLPTNKQGLLPPEGEYKEIQAL